jgi:hypothetical protein
VVALTEDATAAESDVEVAQGLSLRLGLDALGEGDRAARPTRWSIPAAIAKRARFVSMPRTIEMPSFT